MGLTESIKKAILAHSMDKRKRSMPFDINYSDSYQLPPEADGYWNNSQYFSVHDLERRRTLLFRLAQRGGDAPTEVWLAYREGDGPVYLCAGDHFPKGEVLPARVDCIRPGKELGLSFRGAMKQARHYPAVGVNGSAGAAGPVNMGYRVERDGEEIDASLTLSFQGISEPFEFSRHMSTAPVARALAREKLSREFQKALEDNHQVHFEQLGKVTGKLSLGGKEMVLEGIPCFRDHSYGKRNWAYMCRHIWLSGVLENGDYFNTNLVRYPAVKNLQTGFYISGGKTVCLSEATAMDDFPGGGRVPEKLSYQVRYEDGQERTFDCTLDFSIPFYHGGGLYMMHEGVSTFTVNGLKGRGITEFGYNADPNLW